MSADKLAKDSFFLIGLSPPTHQTFFSILFLSHHKKTSRCSNKFDKTNKIHWLEIDLDARGMFQTNHTIYDYGSFAFWGAVLAGGRVMLADGYSAKLHPILAAVKKMPPAGWTTVDVSKLDNQTIR